MAEKKLNFDKSHRPATGDRFRPGKGRCAAADSLKLFEEGTKLVSSCSDMLDKAEQKVVKLVKSADGTPQEVPFAAEEDA